MRRNVQKLGSFWLTIPVIQKVDPQSTSGRQNPSSARHSVRAPGTATHIHGMTDNITRKQNTGEPTSNGGEFGTKQHAEADMALASNARREVANVDIEVGDILVGGSGGRVCIDDIEPSSTMPGFMYVETEFGVLYLDSNGTSTIDMSDPSRNAAYNVYMARKEQANLA